MLTPFLVQTGLLLIVAILLPAGVATSLLADPTHRLIVLLAAAVAASSAVAGLALLTRRQAAAQDKRLTQKESAAAQPAQAPNQAGLVLAAAVTQRLKQNSAWLLDDLTSAAQRLRATGRRVGGSDQFGQSTGLARLGCRR
ncbi:hypothetical protein VZ95_17555 [Elstera litoralis]|uniref:Uncharacterized protein n=1 Tax=Elstera litoralis TaxID=552518 RepID=A0A0F3IP13_9PROT|nr:hypothetical protein [Elstera litoralis]KJV08475.1 hypothetical protein VZ95_17555 [Elstera litoralis]